MPLRNTLQAYVKFTESGALFARLNVRRSRAYVPCHLLIGLRYEISRLIDEYGGEIRIVD